MPVLGPLGAHGCQSPANSTQARVWRKKACALAPDPGFARVSFYSSRASTGGAAGTRAGATAPSVGATHMETSPELQGSADAACFGDSNALAAAAKVTHGFTVQGPAQALAMLTGRKLIENRSWQIPPGWYALHCGSKRESEWGLRAGEICPDLPKEAELRHLFGSIIGLLHITEQRAVEECSGNAWAFGPVCHLVAGAVQFEVPIKYRGNQGLWQLPSEELQQVLKQLQPGFAMPVLHDISVLGPSPIRSQFHGSGWASSGKGSRTTGLGKGRLSEQFAGTRGATSDQLLDLIFY
jgi:hypothetical protein